jgi:hypothetical protein
MRTTGLRVRAFEFGAEDAKRKIRHGTRRRAIHALPSSREQSRGCSPFAEHDVVDGMSTVETSEILL